MSTSNNTSEAYESQEGTEVTSLRNVPDELDRPDDDDGEQHK